MKPIILNEKTASHHHIMNNEKEPGGLISLVVYEGYESVATEARKFISGGNGKMENMEEMMH